MTTTFEVGSTRTAKVLLTITPVGLDVDVRFFMAYLNDLNVVSPSGMSSKNFISTGQQQLLEYVVGFPLEGTFIPRLDIYANPDKVLLKSYRGSEDVVIQTTYIADTFRVENPFINKFFFYSDIQYYFKGLEFKWDFGNWGEYRTFSLWNSPPYIVNDEQIIQLAQGSVQVGRSLYPQVILYFSDTSGGFGGSPWGLSVQWAVPYGIFHRRLRIADPGKMQNLAQNNVITIENY